MRPALLLFVLLALTLPAQAQRSLSAMETDTFKTTAGDLTIVPLQPELDKAS